MIPMDKIYVVTSEWCTSNGDREFAIIGTFFDMQEAGSALNKERDMILKESYSLESVQAARDNEDATVEEDIDRFFIMDSSQLDKWDELKIHEEYIKQRDFIAIQFEYDGETFNERIYLDDIDREHYDNNWDWWFASPEDSKHPDLNFEVFGDKDNDGNIIYDAFEINIYENEDAMDSMATVCDFELTQSWLGKKDGFIKYCDYEQS